MNQKNIMGRRMNIALFCGIMETEFSYSVCEGAMMAAEQLDANLFVFPGGVYEMHSKEEVNMMLETQYNAAYPCVQTNSFDVAVVEYGTITSRVDDKRRKEILAQFGDIPVILIAGTEEGYSSILIDNRSGIKGLVDHLVEEHNCSKIGYVSGPATNQDAIERLKSYKESMQSHNLDCSDDWIVYGDFSEFCTDVTKDLITRHPDIEAILYANDQMAAGGYEVMKSMGLQPGKDILVTGFDDNSLTMMLNPHLTSVWVDVKEIAYRAVMEVPNVIAGKKNKVYSGTKLVVRNSCGCSNPSLVQNILDILMHTDSDDLAWTLAENLRRYFCDSTVSEEQADIATEIFIRYFEYYLHLADEDGILQKDDEKFKEEYSRFLMLYVNGYVSLDSIFFVNRILYDYISKQLKNTEDKLFLMEHVSMLSRELLNQVNPQKDDQNFKKRLFEGIVLNMSTDLLQRSGEENDHYIDVLKKIQQVGFSSGYIHLFEDPLNIAQIQDMEDLNHLYSRGYSDYIQGKSDSCTYYSEKSNIKDIFSSRFLPKERRYNMLVLTLYSREKQYGFFMVESDLDLFQVAGQIATQLSVSIDVLNIMKEQIAIKQDLECNLAKVVETNKVLNEMSRLDPMTGVFNRRGFFQMTQDLLENADNYGKKAITLYADMDCLKTVNDEFGHEEGDFALKATVKFLTGSFRETDVIGRMGGDEFAVFAIIGEETSGERIKQRIQQKIRDFNERCNKPYYVDMSIGVHEFVISKSMNIKEMLNRADEKLYEEKRNKVKQVYK